MCASFELLLSVLSGNGRTGYGEIHDRFWYEYLAHSLHTDRHATSRSSQSNDLGWLMPDQQTNSDVGIAPNHLRLPVNSQRLLTSKLLDINGESALRRFHNLQLWQHSRNCTPKARRRKSTGLYAWNHLGRHVKKGEKGIRILAPIIGVQRRPKEEAEKDITKQNQPVLVAFRPRICSM